MIALLQRVRHASVTVAGRCIGEIQQGLLILLGIEKNDTESDAEHLVQRFVGYRIFSDPDGKMNLSVQEIQGGILLVPQFTLASDTRKGRRPSFSSAAPPEQGEALFDYAVRLTRQQHQDVQTGKFGADMQVLLQNDGPVTFYLRSRD